MLFLQENAVVREVIAFLAGWSFGVGFLFLVFLSIVYDGGENEKE